MHDAARLFLGIWPPPEVRGALQAHALRWRWPAAARPTRAERLHLTLHFIGDVPLARLDELRARLAVPFDAFDMELSRPEVWPGGIAVLCPQETPPALQSLHAGLARRLHELGLPLEQRPWRPHVTLARHAQGAVPPAASRSIAWPAQAGYALVRSLPGGRGYETLQGFD